MLFKTNHHKILQTTPSRTIPYKTIHGSKTPLETIHYSTIFLQKMLGDIFSVKQAFPTSFDTVGNMSDKYTIHLDPTVTPVHHVRCKVLIHYKEEIEKTLKEMEQFRNHNTCNKTNRMGFIYNLSYQTRWLTQNLLRPS